MISGERNFGKNNDSHVCCCYRNAIELARKTAEVRSREGAELLLLRTVRPSRKLYPEIFALVKNAYLVVQFVTLNQRVIITNIEISRTTLNTRS